MSVDLITLANLELQKLRKKQMTFGCPVSPDELMLIINEISGLRPSNNGYPQNQYRVISFPEGIGLEGEITGNGLIHPITILTVYPTGNINSLMPLSPHLYQEMVLDSEVNFRYSTKDGKNVFTNNGETKVLAPEGAVRLIIAEARRLKKSYLPLSISI